jgi:hypothetical protein
MSKSRLLKAGATKEELILSLPKYDFNWQRGYEFKTPIQIAPGTKLITRYEYDNSKNNPANPDPSITVKWGEQSHEEMQYTAFGFRWNEETVENRKPEYQKGLEDSRIHGHDGRQHRRQGRQETKCAAAWPSCCLPTGTRSMPTRTAS